MVRSQTQVGQQGRVGGVALFPAGEGIFLHLRQSRPPGSPRDSSAGEKLLQGILPGDSRVMGIQVQNAAGKPAPGAPEHVLAQVDVQVFPLGLVIAARAGDVIAALPGRRDGQPQHWDDVHHVEPFHTSSFPGLALKSGRSLLRSQPAQGAVCSRA